MPAPFARPMHSVIVENVIRPACDRPRTTRVWERKVHEHLTEKLLLLERLLLRNDYQDLMLSTRAPQLHQKVLRIVRLKEQQIKLLDDLLREMEQYSRSGRRLASPPPGE